MPPQASLHLNEAQQLFDGVNDPLLRPALEAFFAQKRDECVEDLLNALRLHTRDTMREARFAGKVEAYDNALRDMTLFAQEQLEKAKQ